jgi:hypothetical protein
LSNPGGEIQQLYSNLQEIDQLIGKLQLRTETLRTESGHAVGNLREMEYIFYRLTALFQRMHLPPNIASAISLLQHMILTVRVLHSAMIMLETSTPYGWALAGISLLSGIIMAGTSVGSEIASYGGS